MFVCWFDTRTWVRFIKIYLFFLRQTIRSLNLCFFCGSLDFGKTSSVADGMRNRLIPPPKKNIKNFKEHPSIIWSYIVKVISCILNIK